MSDFHDTLAKVHAGECPLCGSMMTIYSANYVTPRDVTFLWCEVCEPEVGWRVQGVHDLQPEGSTLFGMGPMLVASRDLTPDERRKLYDRGDG